jgi:putative nucleotidyltransferase with HDIG domain
MRGHCERLTVLAMHLGLALGLGEEEIETLRLGALLHDIGKIGIPDSVLLKADILNEEEMALMRTHTVIGDNLLEPIDLLASVRPIVRHHHERWDGLGYPDALCGEEIPLGARIMAVAMRSRRCPAGASIASRSPSLRSFVSWSEAAGPSGTRRSSISSCG